MSLKILAKEIGQTLVRNSPGILTGLGIAGVVTTGILAAKGHLKASRILEWDTDCRRAESSKFEVPDLPLMERVKMTWYCYIPAVSVGTTTIICILGSHSVSRSRHAAIASLYTATDAAFRDYKSKVVSRIGERGELAVRDEIVADKIRSQPPVPENIIHTGDGETLCWDSISGRYFYSDIEKIKQTLNRLNDKLLTVGYTPLNDYYTQIGLRRVELGDLVGWSESTGIIDWRISATISEENKPCIAILFQIQPKHLQ